MAIALTIAADDFGMSAEYDRGMIEAARAGAVDGVGVMIGRSHGRLPELLATPIAVGLHIETRAGERLTERELAGQLAEFERAVGRLPDYVDGHHHCHAGAAAAMVAAVAAGRGLPVRSVDPAHRRLLRAAGVATSDLLVGRYEEDEPVLPPELESPPPGVRSIEWMVHPGHPDPVSGSSYDAGREEDLAAVLSFEPPPGIERARHSAWDSETGPRP